MRCSFPAHTATPGSSTQHYGIPLATVGRELRRFGLGRLPRVDGPRRIVRYERDRPGELVHLDIKKLGRIGLVGHRIHGDRRRRTHGRGGEFVHVAIDDHTRLAYVEVLPGETAEAAAGFLARAVAWYAAALYGWPSSFRMYYGPESVSIELAGWCRRRGVRLLHIQPGKPNQSAYIERFNGSYRKEVLDAYLFGSLDDVRAETERWLTIYNTRRPHGSLGWVPKLTFLPRSPVPPKTSYERPA